MCYTLLTLLIEPHLGSKKSYYFVSFVFFFALYFPRTIRIYTNIVYVKKEDLSVINASKKASLR